MKKKVFDIRNHKSSWDHYEDQEFQKRSEETRGWESELQKIGNAAESKKLIWFEAYSKKYAHRTNSAWKGLRSWSQLWNAKIYSTGYKD